jgi:hypothetical protein
MSQARYGAEFRDPRRAITFWLQCLHGTPPTNDRRRSSWPTTRRTQFAGSYCVAGCWTRGQPVVCRATATSQSNYPVPAVRTAFAGPGRRAAFRRHGLQSRTKPTATLLSMSARCSVYGGGVADDSRPGQIHVRRAVSRPAKTATVQVTAHARDAELPAVMYRRVRDQTPAAVRLTFKGNCPSVDSLQLLGPSRRWRHRIISQVGQAIRGHEWTKSDGKSGSANV